MFSAAISPAAKTKSCDSDCRCGPTAIKPASSSVSPLCTSHSGGVTVLTRNTASNSERLPSARVRVPSSILVTSTPHRMVHPTSRSASCKSLAARGGISGTSRAERPKIEISGLVPASRCQRLANANASSHPAAPPPMMAMRRG